MTIGRGSARITGGLNPQGQRVPQIHVAIDEEYLAKIIRELKKMNAYFSLLTGETIESEDVEV